MSKSKNTIQKLKEYINEWNEYVLKRFDENLGYTEYLSEEVEEMLSNSREFRKYMLKRTWLPLIFLDLSILFAYYFL